MSTTAAASGQMPAPVPLRDDAAVIGLVGLAHASSHFAHLLLPPLFPVFAREFGLSFSQLGFLMTVFFIISGTGQALAGFLVDKVGARPVLFAALSSFVAAGLVAGQLLELALLPALLVLWSRLKCRHPWLRV